MTRRFLPGVAAAAGAVIATVIAVAWMPSADAQTSYQRISGEGSSWAANAIDAMRVNVRQFGITVDYNPSGSSAGRKNFLNGTVDFAASDIPFQFQPEDGSAPENPAPGSYAYMPVTAGGTAFLYNLKINGKRVTNLRLSGENVAKIFTGALTQWNDPAIQADNPGITLPARKIVPVVRSEGSGSTAQLTAWMIKTHGPIWTDYCNRSGRAPACGYTSFYPTIPGMIAQSGDLGVAGYVSQSFAEGSIGYVNYSYALGVQFPVAKLLNAAGYYTEPTPENVAVSLLKARINTDESNPTTYLTQNLDGVYTDTDPRNYPMSYYSYLILPTAIQGQFNEAKGKTLGAFAYYAMCQAQQQSASLGYSPMPINLVDASFDQIRKIPGVVVQDIDIKSCKNPTFSADGTNLLADKAPQPQPCDKQGATLCPTGTGGAKNVPTAVSGAPAASGAAGGAAGGASGGASGGAGSGGASPGAQPAAGGAKPTTKPAAGNPKPTTKPATPGAKPTTKPASGGTPSVGTPGATTPQATVPGATVPTGSPDTTLAVVGEVEGATDEPPSTDPSTEGGDGSGQLADPVLAQGEVSPAQPVTLAQSAGWAGATGMVLLVSLLTLGLVFAPAAAWRYFNARKPT